MPEFENTEKENQTQYSPSDAKEKMPPQLDANSSHSSSRSNMRSRWKKRGARSAEASQAKTSIGHIENVKTLKDTFKDKSVSSTHQRVVESNAVDGAISESQSKPEQKSREFSRKTRSESKQNTDKRLHPSRNKEAKEGRSPRHSREHNKAGRHESRRTSQERTRSSKNNKSPQHRSSKKKETFSLFATIKRVIRAVFGIEEDISEQIPQRHYKRTDSNQRRSQQDGRSSHRPRRSRGQNRNSKNRDAQNRRQQHPRSTSQN